MRKKCLKRKEGGSCKKIFDDCLTFSVDRVSKMAQGPGPTNIEELLTCSLCLELFREPKTLKCLHSYCTECLKELTKTSNKHDSILCPLCRDETAIPESGVDGLPTNFFIKNLLDVAELKSKDELLCSNCEDGLKAIVRCLECDQFFCEKCCDAHKRLRLYEDHKVVDLGNLGSPSLSKEFHPAMKCAEHDFVCKFYCRTCNILICRDCTVVDHPLATHSVANLKDVARQCRETSEAALTKAEKHIAHVKQVQHAYQEKNEKLKTSVDTITAELKGKKEHLIQHFIQTIEGRSSEMISRLEQLMSDKIEQGKIEEGQLQSDLRRMRNYVLFMRNLLENGNDDEVMNMQDHLVRYVNDISRRNPFWLDHNNQNTPTVSLQSDIGDDVLDSSVNHLVTTCLGELVLPTLRAKQFELVKERNKVFDVGKDVEVFIQFRSQCEKPPDIKMFHAKVLTPKQTVIHAKLQLHDDGTISVLFTSYFPGPHRLAVELEGNSLRGSPQTLEIKGEIEYSTDTTFFKKLPIDALESKVNVSSLCMRCNRVGNLFILQATVIHVYDPDFKPLYTIQLLAVIEKPWNFTIDSEGRIIVSDTASNKLFVFDSYGTLLHEIGREGKDEGEMKTPLGVTVDSYDDIAVCDSGNGRIQIFKRDSTFKLSFGGERDGEAMYPVSIQFNSQGHIIVAESSLWFSSYRPLPEPPGGFDEANAVECVKIFSRDGQLLRTFGEPGQERGQFWAPIALAVDSWDHIWVADFTYGSVQVFDEKGNVKEVFPFVTEQAGCLSSLAIASNGAMLYLSSPL